MRFGTPPPYRILRRRLEFRIDAMGPIRGCLADQEMREGVVRSRNRAPQARLMGCWPWGFAISWASASNSSASARHHSERPALPEHGPQFQDLFLIFRDMFLISCQFFLVCHFMPRPRFGK